MIYFELKRSILESGLKQIFIAQKMNLDPTLLSKKIHGIYPITEFEKGQLARILNKNLDELFPKP